MTRLTAPHPVNIMLMQLNARQREEYGVILVTLRTRDEWIAEWLALRDIVADTMSHN